MAGRKTKQNQSETARHSGSADSFPLSSAAAMSGIPACAVEVMAEKGDAFG
jgi:hypothetical protein